MTMQLPRRLPGALFEPRFAAAAVAALSAAVLGTALLMQYVGGLAPCPLCITQRWPYVATIALGLLALVPLLTAGARRLLLGLAAAAFFVGSGIALYHAGVELGWFAGPAACANVAVTGNTIEELRRSLMAAPVVRCDEVAWSMFGISIAGYNAIAAAGLGIYAALAALLPFRAAGGNAQPGPDGREPRTT